MDMFSTREIAIASWFLLMFVISSFKREIRKSFLGVLRAFFAIKIVFPALLMASYVVAIVAVLHSIGLWNTLLIKDTILWFLFSATLVMYRYGTARNGHLPHREFLIDSITIVVMIEYVVNAYTFSLAIELMLVPLIALLIFVELIAQRDERYLRVSRLISKLQAFLGLVVVVHVTGKLIADLGPLSSMDTVRSILLAPLLTLGSLPLS
jgi:hypothetical protein